MPLPSLAVLHSNRPHLMYSPSPTEWIQNAWANLNTSTSKIFICYALLSGHRCLNKSAQEWVLHTKAKKKVQANICPEMNGFWVSLKNKYLNDVTFYHTWHKTFAVNVHSLITVEFLLYMKSQFRTNAQNILHLNQCTHGHVSSWTVVLFQRSRGACEWFDRHQ